MQGEPKMLEYNADTPTTVLEAATIQDAWRNEMFASAGQLNTVHNDLVERWKVIKAAHPTIDTVHFCCVADHEEDFRCV